MIDWCLTHALYNNDNNNIKQIIQNLLFMQIFNINTIS